MSASVKQDTKPVILIDGSAVAYAAFHSTGHLSYEGLKTGVIYGFLTKILTIAEKFKTNDFIFCWDAGVSYRHNAFSKYKWRRWQKREEMSPSEKKEYESLLLQLLQLDHEVLPNMGFKNNFIQMNFEADDLLAHWTNRLYKNRKVIMVTTDADMFQCLDKCDIWFPTKKKLFTQKDMLEKYGTSPKEWPMAKAIGGCSTDGVPGIVGISDPKNPKSKVHKYLKGKLTKGVVYERIHSKEGQQIINRNLPIVTVPYREDLMKRMILRRNLFTKRRFIKEFSRHRFISFLEDDRFNKWEKYFINAE